MIILIIIFGVLTFITGTIIIINPESISGFFSKYSEKLELHILAVIVRLILGVLFIYQSDVSKFPLVIEILGWLFILSAIFFAAIGRNNFNRIILWALSLSEPVHRVGGVAAVCLGSFLIYAFI